MISKPVGKRGFGEERAWEFKVAKNLKIHPLLIKKYFMKRIIIIAASMFVFAACNSSGSDSSSSDSTSVQSTQMTPGVSTGAEGTDTGKSVMTNAASGEKSGSDTTLRNGKNGLNNEIQQQPDSSKKQK